MAAPIVLFDLDGTLVDTAPDLVGTLNVIFAREGLPAVEYDAARNMVGGGARLMIERGLAANGRDLAAAEVDRMVRDYIDHYALHLADRSKPFPGVEAALDRLADKGCRLAVCTNKLEWLSLRLLDALGLTGRFVAICGSDTFRLQKPNPDFLLRTIERDRRPGFRRRDGRGLGQRHRPRPGGRNSGDRGRFWLQRNPGPRFGPKPGDRRLFRSAGGDFRASGWRPAGPRPELRRSLSPYSGHT